MVGSLWTDWALTVDEDGVARLEGVETGKLVLHSLERDVLVIAEAGHRYWSRIGGEWPYAPAQLHVLRIDGATRDAVRPDRLRIAVLELLATIPTRRYVPPEAIAALLAVDAGEVE